MEIPRGTPHRGDGGKGGEQIEFVIGGEFIQPLQTQHLVGHQFFAAGRIQLLHRAQFELSGGVNDTDDGMLCTQSLWPSSSLFKQRSGIWRFLVVVSDYSAYRICQNPFYFYQRLTVG